MKTAQFIWISALCFSQVQAFTLPRQPIKSYECDVCTNLSHENLHDKWSISNQSLNTKISNTQKSYGYKERVTLEQLNKGVIVTTLAPGAVIRITPIENKLIPALIIETPTRQILSLKEASALYSENEAFGNTSLSSKNQTMLQIKPELGAGRFTIKTKELNPSNSKTYVLSVLDKASTGYLQVETNSVHYQYGDKINASISIEYDGGYYEDTDVIAALVNPRGEIIPMELTKIKSHHYEASAILKSEINDKGENWYLEVQAEAKYGDDTIKRHGHTAFSYSVPSASLISVRKISSKPLTFVAALDVATGSRYALQSVLYRRGENGTPRPIETSQRAQWLEPGKQVIQFTFDNSSQLAEDNLYLGYLRITDYGQLKTVYQYNEPIRLTELVD